MALWQKKNLNTSIFVDDRASDALPMRFTAAAIILLVLVFLSWTAISATMEKKSIHDTEAAISIIDSNAGMISANGAGSRVTLDINIPAKVTLVLGGVPDREEKWPEDARNYYFRMDSRQFMGESTASYSNEYLNGTAVLGPGSHKITLESVKRTSDNRIFVKVYENSREGQ
ncbi:hypothetical protein [Methanolobus halotolerans]|uniref:Uncharacterized protein n=1 Tax=Methanolobus halotolerans TaxID=2052935 RepID=A0A4E0Q0S5_9EURY|nr:hypothetical protein [Methanolobus halotolerans]TGC10572.1 hypothetical protein CUN85_03505 [Methanolobus halotolerans]